MLQRAQVLCPRLPAAYLSSRQFHVSPICERTQAARYKITPKRDRPLTYEMANPPHFIGDRKAWNSWNICKLNQRIVVNRICCKCFVYPFLQRAWKTVYEHPKQHSKIFSFVNSWLEHFIHSSAPRWSLSVNTITSELRLFYGKVSHPGKCIFLSVTRRNCYPLGYNVQWH